MASFGRTRLSASVPLLLLLVLQVLVADVASQGVSTCALCQRDPGSCRRIAGLYTVTVLSKGTYNPVVEIPPQACSINITELAPSQNYLAVKTDRGDNIVNGRWSVGSTGTYRGVGTTFSYHRDVHNCPGECVTSAGPTDRRIVVQVLYYNKNPGIAYSFILPNDVPFQPFDEVVPKGGDSRHRSHHRRRGQGHRNPEHRQTAAAVSDPAEPYVGGARQGTSQLQEPRGPVTSHRGRTPTGAATNRDIIDARSPPNGNAYRGSSYGSHTLGGRGQSYTYQYATGSESNSNNNNPAADSSSSSGGRGRGTSGPQYTPSRGSASRNRETYNPSRSRGIAYSSRGGSVSGGRGSPSSSSSIVPGSPSSRGIVPGSPSSRGIVPGSPSSRGIVPGSPSSRGSLSRAQYLASRRRPAFARRPAPRRDPAPAWRQPQTPTYISAYDTNKAKTDSSRGYQTLAASSSGSRGGLVDRTFSRTAAEAENRLQTFERPVDRRPALSIGTGGSGNEYEWTISGLTECSRSCGGGRQETQVVCVLMSSSTQVVVTPDNCLNALKPRLQRVSCSNDPCLPEWQTEEWSSCTVTCGGGTQSRRIECRQRFSETLELSVSATQCGDPADRPAVAQQCNNDPCAMWKEGPFGECSAECGGGERERSTECTDGQGVQIPDTYCPGEKPASKEPCNEQPCSTQWWHTHWSTQCSADCGSGFTSRHVVCTDRSGSPVEESSCERDQRPRDRKRCESSEGCGSSWFAGQWSQCSDSCGQGVRTRQVVCMRREQSRGTLDMVDDDQCPADTKPSAEEACINSECGAQYYVTAWSQCSVTCGSGLKSRQIRCLDEDQQPSYTCDRTRAPSQRETCELAQCPRERQPTRERERERPAQTSRSHGNCKDKFWTCRLAVQARLCSFDYYKSACCLACRKS